MSAHDHDHAGRHEHRGDDDRHDKHRHHHGHHGHGDHQAHSHGAEVDDERRIGWAFGIIFLFMIVEAGGGLIAGSLALLADAGHMASDAAALGMSWIALRIGKRPADAVRSYGYQRIEVLVAFVNGCALFVIAAWIVFEAVRRFAAPAPVLGGTMLVVAIAGLLANIVAFLVLNGGNRNNLNMRSAWLHVLGDLLGFVVAIIAAGIILLTGWSPIDPMLSILVVVLILKSAGEIVRSSAHILLEGTPPGIDLDALRTDLAATVPAVAEVHHVHAWSLTAGHSLVTLHVRCAPDADPVSVIPAINSRLKDRFGIAHSTIQIETADCPDEHHL
ncbi:MAG TPA: cation diffusion facilitator family transporter [Stellaceae bacterium]|nr:cation diffusion facilitator family transporter [Stellaceae bacterium]